MLTIERSLNIYAAGIPQIISLSQYDDDFQLVFSLYTSEGVFTIPSGTTAEVMGTKVDGNGYSASASISDSTVTVTGNKQMTACAGRNVYEIVLTQSGKRLATVNFILKVERAALDADTIQSETVLKELNAIIDSAATATEAATEAAASAAAAAESARTLTIDPTLTKSGQAADAKATGDAIAAIEPGLSEEAKAALLACFAHVGWEYGDGQQYYNALAEALAGEEKTPVSITATYAQQKIIDSGSSLNVLIDDLSVIATYEDGTSSQVYSYELTGTLSNTRSTVTVTYKGLTAEITVVVAPANRWVNDVLTIPASEISTGGINGVAPSYVNTQTAYRRAYVGAWIDLDPAYQYVINAVPSSTLTLQLGICGVNSKELSDFAKGTEYVSYSDTGWKSNGYTYTPTGTEADKVMLWVNCRKSDNSQFGSATVSRFEITRTLL